ncbi:ribonuclease R [Flammeovirga yaeyamensis]|uniref:Ribonuclease R n=1 Tax=Flammeovirga yaeyamensis TaxID=367791 RepID=A0AAX1N332_9BACT|nr:ribonuclease R [Flammeovirga yaeyamensis]MBB3700975.1 ribonuclease R [Flammeovirga yaeyamensis]NMF38191.1 ribonuclease R [Flammeovirga yaeyamensis]QWG01960.1 ribonuclease R [Flammeovirga yaeyamensis]
MTKGKKKNKKENSRGKRKPQKRSSLNKYTIENIINLLNSSPESSFSLRQINKEVRIKSQTDKDKLKYILAQMAEEGKLQIKGKKYQSITLENEISESRTATVDFVNPKFAFLIVDTNEDEEPQEDIRVIITNMNRALHGDKVEFTTFYNRNRNRTEAKITKILKREKDEYVGQLQVSDRFAFVAASDRKMFFDFFIPRDQIGEANHGDKVIVKMTQWKPNDKSPTGKIIKILGKAGENNTEIHSIMFEFGLPFEFPKEVEAEANMIPDEIPEEEIKNRKDFRNRTTFTIDPLTAKDFDDALSIRKMKNGHYEIGVHIADVTHYVRPGSQLEEEALKRATSVYLVDRTVPMLPEKLSNGLCSLNPNVDRLAFGAIFEMDEDGKIHKQQFGRTVIHSDRRFTYEEAQERIESGKGDYQEEINILNDIALKLRNQRFKNGAISFESVELKFDLDEEGKPIGLTPKIRKDAHKMIEEFMLLANKRVAESIFRKKQDGKPCTMVYRVHGDPDPDKLAQFATFAKRFGYDLNLSMKKLPQTLNKLTDEVEGKPEQNIIEQQAIRTMAKAVYTTTAEGHYGLGFAHYTHFTSPIRRYPDMMVHRLLQHYLDKGKSADENEYEDKCKHSSAREKVAADAERASIKYKQVEFMSEFLGEEMEGTISGLTDWGMFVELNDTRCEGLIRYSSMTGDQYIFDSDAMIVQGVRYKEKFQLGDPIKVIVKETNIEKRSIDFELV